MKSSKETESINAQIRNKLGPIQSLVDSLIIYNFGIKDKETGEYKEFDDSKKKAIMEQIRRVLPYIQDTINEISEIGETEETVSIPTYVFENIWNSLRLTNNMFIEHDSHSCLSRMVARDWEYVNELKNKLE